MKHRKSRLPRPGVTGMGAPARREPQASGEPAPAAGEPAHQRFHGVLIGLALFALTLSVYSNSFGVGMILDNKGLLLLDPRIREATAKNAALIFTHSYSWPFGEDGMYRPLTTLSYLFNYAILGDGDRPEGYHWINLALHTINVLLVFALARRLLGRLVPAALLAALWAVHPASTESVTNIIGRSDLLAGMAMLGGLLIYVKSTTAGGWRIVWLVGLGMLTAAGVASKESAMMIAAVIVLYELAWPGRRRWLDLLSGLLATGIPIAAMWFLRASVLAASPPAEFPFTDNPIVGAGFWTGRLTALKVAGLCLVQAVWPWRLSIDYSYSQIPLGIRGAEDCLAVAMTLLAVAGLVGLWRWNRTAFFLVGFAVVAFLPTSNLLIPIGSIRADRFLYLPSMGVLGCVVLALSWFSSRLRSPLLAPLVLLVLAAGFAARTRTRNAEWRDELTLASADVRTSPRSFKLHRLLASTLLAADPSRANIDHVVEEVDESLAIVDPLPDLQNVPETYYLGGAAYLEKGDRLQKSGTPGAEGAYRRARELLERCIRINLAHERQIDTPGVVGRTKLDAYRLLPDVYRGLGDIDGALQAARTVQRTSPQDPEIYNQIADLLLKRQQGNQAAVALTEGMLITSDPGLRDNLVRLYGSSSDPANCTLVAGPNGPAVNPRCQIVLDHTCAAAPGVLSALMDSGRRQEAMEKKQMFMKEYRCAPERLNEVLPR